MGGDGCAVAGRGGGRLTPLKKGKRRVITEADRGFWSFKPPVDVAAPVVKDAGWCANDVDRFVFAKLAAEGLTPAPEADKVTLVRRAYLDLQGFRLRRRRWRRL